MSVLSDAQSAAALSLVGEVLVVVDDLAPGDVKGMLDRAKAELTNAQAPVSVGSVEKIMAARVKIHTLETALGRSADDASSLAHATQHGKTNVDGG